MRRGRSFDVRRPQLVLAAVVVLLAGCGGSEAEPDDTTEDAVEVDEEEPDSTDEDAAEETEGTDPDDNDPTEEPAEEEAEEPADTDDGEVDIFALQRGDVIEGTYEFGFPESGDAFGCVWLDTEQGRITLLSGVSTDEDGRVASEPAVGFSLEGIVRYQEGDRLEDEADQIVAVGELVRIELAGPVGQIQEYGSIRDGCGDPEDPLVMIADAEPIG